MKTGTRGGCVYRIKSYFQFKQNIQSNVPPTGASSKLRFCILRTVQNGNRRDKLRFRVQIAPNTLFLLDLVVFRCLFAFSEDIYCLLPTDSLHIIICTSMLLDSCGKFSLTSQSWLVTNQFGSL